MTEPFIHHPSLAMIVASVLYWGAELVITMTLVITGLRDMVLWRQSHTRLSWLRSLTTRKRRRVKTLGLIGLFLGMAALIASLLLVIVPNWGTFQDSDPAFVLTVSLRSGWALAATGLIPFVLGQILLSCYQNAHMIHEDRNLTLE